MSERTGIEISYTCLAWLDAQNAVLNGQADAIGGMVRSTEREKKFTLIKELVPNPPEHFFFNTNEYKGTEPEFARLVREHELIGGVNGDYAVERLHNDYPGIELKEYSSSEDVASAASRHEIRVFVMEESVAFHHLDRLGIGQIFSRSAAQLFQEWLWAAVRKGDASLQTS